MSSTCHEQTGLKVSVIIPTYNRAGYLREALNSVLRQSLPPREVIVVDDGSTDGTAGVVDSYGSSVRYVRHGQNRGISAARNTGITTAQGDVIAWLDSDDLWEPHHLATLLPVLSDDGIAGAYAGLTRIDEEGNALPQISCWVVPPNELASSLVESCRIQTSTFVVRTRCYDRVGLFDTRFDICEDYDMFIRLAESHRIMGIPSPSVKYRVHSQNTVSDMAAYCRFRLALTAKHYGTADTDSRNWPGDKRRAYAYAYRAAGLKCIQHGQSSEGWQYLNRAVCVYPNLLKQVDTYYELACGDQPMGYRGAVEVLDTERSGTELLRHLDDLFANASPDVRAVSGASYGYAYLALAMLTDQAGQWQKARTYLWQAITVYPPVIRECGTIRRLLKLCAGQRVVNWLRRQR